MYIFFASVGSNLAIDPWGFTWDLCDSNIADIKTDRVEVLKYLKDIVGKPSARTVPFGAYYFLCSWQSFSDTEIIIYYPPEFSWVGSVVLEGI